MAKFKYSMENILRIKERVEEQKRMALGQAMMDYQRAVDVQKGIEHKLLTDLERFYNNQDQKTNATMLKALTGQVAYTEQELKDQKKKVAIALREVEIKREALRKALEERKIQEKLKEHAYDAWLEEEKIKEQQLLDEVVGYRYATDDESVG